MKKIPKTGATIHSMHFVIAVGIVLGLSVAILGVRAGLVWRSVGDYQQQWTKRNAEPQSFEGVTLIALGDSAAQGVGASRLEHSYVARLEQAIARKTGKPVRVINLSKSGATINDVLQQQIPNIVSYRSDPKTIITLDIGANDVVRGTSHTTEFKDSVAALFGTMPSDVIVADLPYLGKSRLQSKNPDMITANSLFYTYAKQYGQELVPLYETLKSRNSYRVYAGDFFHPSDYGYQLWFDSFWPAVERRLDSTTQL